LAAPIHALRAKRAQHLPKVLSKTEVNQLLSGMQGLRHLRGKDIDIEQYQVVVRVQCGYQIMTKITLYILLDLSAGLFFFLV
jgi:hypothetical protein